MDDPEIEEKVRAAFPADAVAEVQLLRHGDDPEVEPGNLLVRVVANPQALPDAFEHTLSGFHTVYGEEIRRLAEGLGETLPPETSHLQFVAGDEGNRFFLRLGSAAPEGARQQGLVPVMARLGPLDIETLDTLIGAGIAPNRAEAVRWALAKLRERPAYAALREHGRALEELKAAL